MGNAPVDVRVKQLSLKVVRVLEILLCVLLICGIVVEGGHIALALPTLGSSPATFESFLDHALVYIIGLEIVLMLIHRDPYLVIDIVSFAIARKMVMTTENGLDFVLGSVAIFILYYVKCYGINCKLPWTRTGPSSSPFDWPVKLTVQVRQTTLYIRFIEAPGGVLPSRLPRGF